MPDYRIELELAEPLFCGSKHAVSNEMTSLEFIPCTSLRGSLAAELMYSGRACEVPLWFGATGPRWTPALPTLSEDARKRLGDEEAFIVPMPLSFSREKRDGEPFTGSFGVFDGLSEETPDNEEEYTAKTGLGVADKDKGRQQWTGLRQKWLLVSKGQPYGVFTHSPTISMHVGLHYGRQANRDQALFSRRGISRNGRFVAWVQDEAGVLKTFPLSATVGKRTSTGNGFVRLVLKEGLFPWLGSGGSDESEATVQLISDAIVLDGEGRYLQGLNASNWERILGMKVSVKAASATRRIRNWSNTWGLPREHTLAIAAGSVFRIVSAKGGAEWKASLDKLAKEGLGRMRHEGFGWVAVNPAWLKKPFYAPQAIGEKDLERQRKRDPAPTPWPGLEGAERQRVLDALAKAKEQAGSGKLKGMNEKIGALGSYAARVKDAAQVAIYLKALGERQNANGWDTILREIGGDLSGLESIELVRFFLNGVETLHG